MRRPCSSAFRPNHPGCVFMCQSMCTYRHSSSELPQLPQYRKITNVSVLRRSCFGRAGDKLDAQRDHVRLVTSRFLSTSGLQQSIFVLWRQNKRSVKAGSGAKIMLLTFRLMRGCHALRRPEVRMQRLWADWHLVIKAPI